MQKRLVKFFIIPVALLVFAFLSYGILAPSLGFYWDDWPMIWFAHSLGPAGYQEVFSGDRPFLAGVYILTTSLLKTVPLPWQILAILSRWITGLSLWWALRKLWPRHFEPVTWIALLFVIYPGFKQQPISVVYSNGFFLLTFYVLSLGFMFMAIRNRARYWVYTLLALFFYAAAMFSTEYYIGLDMLRPVLIWIVLSETIPDLRQKAIRTVKQWWPYLGMLIVYLVWRVLIFGFPTYTPKLVGEASQSPVNAIFTLLTSVIGDVFTAGFRAWTYALHFPDPADFQSTSYMLLWAVVLISAPLLWFFLSRASRRKEADEPDVRERLQWSYQALAVGLIGLLVAGWPIWITNLPLSLEFPWDRFTLSFMIPSCILVVGLFEWILRTRFQKLVLLTLVASMAIGTNFFVTNTYRRDWNNQKDFFWQMVWRAPSLKPGTLILTHNLPLLYYSDNSLTAPLNWIYAPDTTGATIPYFLAYTRVRLGASIPALKENQRVSQVYRNVSFVGNTSNALTIFYSPPGCLRMLDPKRDRLPIYPGELEPAINISHLDQIVTDPAQPARPPGQIFGAEPEHGWCYYFESAELARQRGDWQQVAALGDEAGAKGFSAGEPSENMVFVDGLGHTGRWDEAMNLLWKTYQKNKKLQSNLCVQLTALANIDRGDVNGLKSIATMQGRLDCPK